MAARRRENSWLSRRNTSSTRSSTPAELRIICSARALKLESSSGLMLTMLLTSLGNAISQLQLIPMRMHNWLNCVIVPFVHRENGPMGEPKP